MEYKLAQKAYKIDFSRIEEGYLYSEITCHAESLNKAKVILLSKCKYENVCLHGTDDEVTYLSIPVIRCKELDKYQFEDKEYTKFKIEEILNNRKRISDLDSLINDDQIKYCYITKGSYYRPNSRGYTDFIFKAGVFTKEYAVSNAKSVSSLKIIPINIEEHNSMISEEINDLQSRIIKPN